MNNNSDNNNNQANFNNDEFARYSRTNAASYKKSQNSMSDTDYNAYENTQESGPNFSGLDVQTDQYSRTGNTNYSYKKNTQMRHKKRKKNIIVCAVILVVLAISGFSVYKFHPINVKINDKECQLMFDKTLQKAIEVSGIKVKPGNFIAVDDSIIKEGEGYEYYCEVNGTAITDTNYPLNNEDVISYQNGKNKMEEYTSVDTDVPATAEITGTGAIHKFVGDGTSGTWSQMTGKVSGKYAEKLTKEPQNVNCTCYNVNPGSDKVLALTFDDGPNKEYTTQILELLKKYNAKATFFTLGENCEENWAKELLQEEDKAEHQICTHTYDNAAASGGIDITALTNEAQIQEIMKGQSAITKALGHEGSKVIRLPGGNFNENTIRLLAPYATAEIGTNVESGDWKIISKDKIVEACKTATSGDVIQLHDGGGDRSETVKALQEILPYFAEKGYKFVTVDELIQYPEASQKTYK